MKRIYIAVVRRIIPDEVEIQLIVNNDDVNLSTVEKEAEEMEKNLPGFDPMGKMGRIETKLTLLDLVERRGLNYRATSLASSKSP